MAWYWVVALILIGVVLGVVGTGAWAFWQAWRTWKW